MSLPTQCKNCFKAHDFIRECFGCCATCKKDYMCEGCCYSHECVPGKSRNLRIITNPAWICNLVKTLSEVEPLVRPQTPPSLKEWEDGVLSEWNG